MKLRSDFVCWLYNDLQCTQLTFKFYSREQRKARFNIGPRTYTYIRGIETLQTANWRRKEIKILCSQMSFFCLTKQLHIFYDPIITKLLDICANYLIYIHTLHFIRYLNKFLQYQTARQMSLNIVGRETSEL